MAGVLYSIRDWDKHFENAQSRKVEKLTWVASPNKHDGKSYRRLITMPDGPAIYGAWNLIVQVASKCPTRGVLADADGPLTADDLAVKTGAPESLFDAAFEILCGSRVSWLTRSVLPDGSHTRGAEWNGMYGMYGMELNGMGGKEKGVSGKLLFDEAPQAPADISPESNPPAHPLDDPPKAPRNSAAPEAAHPAAQPPAEIRAEDLPLPPALDCDEFLSAWTDWVRYRRENRWSVRPKHMTAQLERLAGMGSKEAIAAIRYSISQVYQGLFQEKKSGGQQRVEKVSAKEFFK